MELILGAEAAWVDFEQDLHSTAAVAKQAAITDQVQIPECLHFLCEYSQLHRELAQLQGHKARVTSSEEQAARTRDPYGEQNLKDAAKFLSTRIRDGKHGGDKAKFFDHLDDDNDGSITLEEIKAVEEHAAELNAEKPGGLWKMMHTLLETKSQRGFHGELHAHLDADGDGTVTSAEFHEL